MKPVYKYTGLALSALALFILSLLILFSASHVEKIVTGVLYEHSGISFIAEDFSRAFPLGFHAKGVSLSAIKVKQDAAPIEIAEIDALSVKLKVAPLFIGKEKLSYLARLEDGEIEGEAFLDEKVKFSVRAKDFPLKAALQLSSLGVTDGSVSGVASFIVSPGGCLEGSATLDAADIDIGGLKSQLPAILLGERVKGSLAFETTANCMVDIKSLFIEGRALKIRLKGTVRIKSPVERSVLDMKVEIFIKPGEAGKEANKILLSTMNQYKRSSSYYLMSLKGTIGNPSIRR